MFPVFLLLRFVVSSTVRHDASTLCEPELSLLSRRTQFSYFFVNSFGTLHPPDFVPFFYIDHLSHLVSPGSSLNPVPSFFRISLVNLGVILPGTHGPIPYILTREPVTSSRKSTLLYPRTDVVSHPSFLENGVDSLCWKDRELWT